MFILREVNENDLDDLYELSRLVFFISLPRDKDLIREIINSSVSSFKKPSSNYAKNNYIFVLENLENNKIVGVSMIHAQHGTPEEPHFYLKVGRAEHYSETLNTGFVHGTLKLGQESNGPTEIGGLVIHPDFRNHPEKLGKQLSFVRFLYIGLNREKFKDDVHCELMPPLDSNGNSPLWEAIGREFLNMDYHDADKLSRKNKEFITSLFPSETIYVTLLPIEARNSIGKVGKDTRPVKNMLEKIGFKYKQEVDPFDGGPHYGCKVDEIKTVQSLTKGKLNYDKKYCEDRAVQVLFKDPLEKNFKAYFITCNLIDQYLVPSEKYNNLLKKFNGVYVDYIQV